MHSKPNSEVDKISLSALKDFNGNDLHALYKTTEVTFQGETVAVLIPYQKYLDMTKLLLDADAKLDELSNAFAESIEARTK